MKNIEVMEEALAVLSELVSDVNAVGPAAVKDDWPDIFQTYKNAKDLLCRARKLDI